jgi:hypothetical protein
VHPWNGELFRVLEGFPDLAHDDEVDACSGALEIVNPPIKDLGIHEPQRQRAEAGFQTTARGAGFGARFCGMGGLQKAKLNGTI